MPSALEFPVRFRGVCGSIACSDPGTRRYGGKALCYVTDTEHVGTASDRNILELIAGCDLMIYDSSCTDDGFPAFVNWGHSTWQEGVRLADAASVKTFVAFHHDPSHDDDRMDAIAAEIEQRRPGSVVAHEGLVLAP